MVARGGKVLTVADRPVHAFHVLRAEVKLWVAASARSMTFVHAGVVGWGDRAVLVPGRTFAGKTTLVRALTRAGASYYSDDMAVIDVRGDVHPYPVPLGQRPATTGLGSAQSDLPIERLGGPIGHAPIPVGLVLITRYVAGAAWQPVSISPGATGLGLMAHTVGARRRPDRAMDVLAAVTRSAEAWRSDRCDTDEVVQFVRQRLGEADPRPDLTRTR